MDEGENKLEDEGARKLAKADWVDFKKLCVCTSA